MHGYERRCTSPRLSAGLKQTALWRSLRLLPCTVLLMLLVACGTLRQASVDAADYRVQRGDTLTHIARKVGRTVSELQRWNKLPNANRITVGQRLRVVPPDGVPAKRATPSPTDKPRARAPATTKLLACPAQGQMLQTYNGTTSRGLTITNSAGTPIVAAAAGSVLYAGSGLRAYGNLIILEHEGKHLTIYAHNRTLFVKEGQQVAQGEKIAEMGNIDHNRVALYFELRRNGQPINPVGLCQ